MRGAGLARGGDGTPACGAVAALGRGAAGRASIGRTVAGRGAASEGRGRIGSRTDGDGEIRRMDGGPVVTAA